MMSQEPKCYECSKNDKLPNWQSFTLSTLGMVLMFLAIIRMAGCAETVSSQAPGHSKTGEVKK